MRVCVHDPVTRGRVVLRTAHDWDRDIERVQHSSTQAWFELEVPAPSLELEPMLVGGAQVGGSPNQPSMPSSMRRRTSSSGDVGLARSECHCHPRPCSRTPWDGIGRRHRGNGEGSPEAGHLT
jgi:hypothetical protein